MHCTIYLYNIRNVCLKTFAQTILTAVPAVVFHQGGLLADPERSVYLSTTEVNLHFFAFPEAVSCSVEPWPQPLLHHVRHLNRSSDHHPTTITAASFFSSTFTAAQLFNTNQSQPTCASFITIAFSSFFSTSRPTSFTVCLYSV